MGGLLSLLCAAACSDETSDSSLAEAGAGGEPAAAGGAGTSEAGEPGIGGAGGAGGVREPTPVEVADEIERIVGTSFVVRAGDALEHGAYGVDCSNQDALEVSAFINATLSFVEGESGGLDVLVSTPLPWLRIERSSLSRTAEGWVVDEPVALGGCMVHAFEEELEEYWAIPDELLLRFDGADTEAPPTEVSVHAHWERVQLEHPDAQRDPQTVLGEGQRDDEPPRLWQAPKFGHLWDDGGASSLYWPMAHVPYEMPVRFDFSEPLRPGWSVAIEDEQGERWLLAEDDSGADFTTAIEVARYFPRGYRWIVEGEDLAGNPLSVEGDYPGGSLSPVDGDFEAATSLAMLTRTWSGDHYTPLVLDEDCEGAGACISATFPGQPGLTAIAGETSLASPAEAQSSRTLFLVVARAQGATTLRFQARLVGESVDSDVLSISTATLVVGEIVESETLEVADWQVDVALSPDASEDSEPQVSELREVTVPLAAGDGELLVRVTAGSGLWLDSLRTE